MTSRSTRALCYAGAATLAASTFFLSNTIHRVSAEAEQKITLHYAANGNFDLDGNYMPGEAGFNLADVSNVSQLDSLPNGIKGLVWVGQCNGVDKTFIDTVQPYVGRSNLLGFYFMDDPDPTGWHFSLCTANNLRAESDWIHANVPGAVTFIVLMNMSSSKTPSFTDTYNPANSHIDLFGLDPYPCRSELNGCDYDVINRYVAAAESWGIPRDSMVPVYQTFGGGNWRDGEGGQYTLPTVREEQQILSRWRALVPAPMFDFAYSWSSQHADLALDSSPDLRAVFSLRNRSTNGSP